MIECAERAAEREPDLLESHHGGAMAPREPGDDRLRGGGVEHAVARARHDHQHAQDGEAVRAGDGEKTQGDQGWPITMVAVTPQRSAMRPAGRDISEGPM